MVVVTGIVVMKDIFLCFYGIFCVLLLTILNNTHAAEKVASTKDTTQKNITLVHSPQWRVLEPGMESLVCLARTATGKKAEVRVVRFDPFFFDFVILTATMYNERSRSLTEWVERYDLLAAINAGMFLPDNLTNTGYLRTGKHENNRHIAERLGAFFMTAPRRSDLPSVALLGRDEVDINAMLSQYDMVVQNFRLISADREILWKTHNAEHAVAAVGRDAQNHILFILCQDAVNPHEFGQILLAMPLDIRLVMYVEGGAQAGMAVRQTDNNVLVWMGHHLMDLLALEFNQRSLPNVIGVRRKVFGR